MLALLVVLQLAQAPDLRGAPPAILVPRIAGAAAMVDGVLDEPVWLQAARLGDFSQYLPADGRPADDSTVALVWYSPTAIYFGIRAYQDSTSVRATLADRDRIIGDDQILLLFDTFNDRRQALLLAVNPLGQQADGTLQDAARQVATMQSAASSGAYAVDLSPDYVFESRGRLTATGYEVEIRIPFKTLRYQPRDPQDWGFNIIRRVQASGHEEVWAPVLHSDASFLGRSGTLAGLTGLHGGLVLDLTPEATTTVSGAPGASGWGYSGGRPELGATARWGVTSNLTLNGTVNPDFSQVEADVAQIQYDPREALFYPEKRPFFLDGLERFRTPVQLIYTRRLVNPIAAVNLTGKVGPTSLAFLSGVDDRDLSRSGRDSPFLTAVRVRRDAGQGGTLGAVVTDREDGAAFNRVGAVDGRFVFGGANTLIFQGGGSATRSGGETRWGPFWYASFNHAGRRFALTAFTRGLHPDFRTESGFIARPGVAYLDLQPSYTHQAAPGAWLESVSGSVRLEGRWDYDRLRSGASPNDPKVHLNLGLAFRGGWQLGTSVLLESFRYPPELYAGYALDNGCVLPALAAPDSLPPCALPFTGTERIANLDWVLNVATPRFQRFAADLSLIVGRDENFFEWAPATIIIATLDVTWRPSEQLRVNLLYNHQQYIRPGDGSTVGQRRVPRLKVEYQLTRSIFLRLVGQYDAEATDALRDDSRTNLPILVRDPATGAWVRTGPLQRNDLQADWLFSFRPTPGTVFFAGYGSSLSEASAFRFRGLGRVRDGFFFKASYLFRM